MNEKFVCLFVRYLYLLLNIVIRNIVNIITICIKCVRVCVCTLRIIK